MANHIGRRKFLATLGGVAAAWPLATRAQQPGKLPTIGFLGSGTAAQSQWTGAFVQRLRELGWIEGRTVAIEYRWAEARTERYAEIAAEFVRMKVDVIVTTGAALLAAKQTASTIPVVFAVAADPVGSGLVASLAQPGGNITGLSLQQADAAGKRLELLREVLPDLRRLAIMANVGSRGAAIDLAETETAAHRFGLETVALDIRRTEDIAPAFETIKGRADALYVVGDPLTNNNRMRINILALVSRRRTSSGSRLKREA
jgi:putative ABC transport system substrate-binding protein